MLILVFFIGVAFWWSLRSGQYDDMEGPGYRVLMDDDKAARPQRDGESALQAPSDDGERLP